MKKIKKSEFFTSNINIEKTYWFYFDKFEQDISIYYFKNDLTQEKQNTDGTNSSNATNLSAQPLNSTHSSSANNSYSESIRSEVFLNNQNKNVAINFDSVDEMSFFNFTEKTDNFSNKLKLWKCCTLIKQANMTLEKIVNRIKNERFANKILQFWSSSILFKFLFLIGIYGMMTLKKDTLLKISMRTLTCTDMLFCSCHHIHRETFMRLDTRRRKSKKTTIRLLF